MAKGIILNKLFSAGPLFLLYYLSISEVDTNFEKLFDESCINYRKSLKILLAYWRQTFLFKHFHVISIHLFNHLWCC